MSTPAPRRDRASCANVARPFPRLRPQRPVSGLRAGSGRGGRVHVGDCESSCVGAMRVRWGWRESCLRNFRDSFGGRVTAGRLKPRTAKPCVFVAAHAATGLKRPARGTGPGGSPAHDDNRRHGERALSSKHARRGDVHGRPEACEELNVTSRFRPDQRAPPLGAEGAKGAERRSGGGHP